MKRFREQVSAELREQVSAELRAAGDRMRPSTPESTSPYEREILDRVSKLQDSVNKLQDSVNKLLLQQTGQPS